jgi:putative peptide zinc metalloprotease protein
MDSSPLPALRQELTLHNGPLQADGSPGWLLHDPAANRFYLLGWAGFELLSRWSLGNASALLAAVNTQTTLQLANEDIDQLLRFLSANQLLQVTQSDGLWQLHQRRKAGYLMWLLKHYLFIRIPLVHPDKLLQRLLPWVSLLFRPLFWWMMAAVTVSGLVLVSQRWDAFTHTFSHYAGWSAALGIAVALSLAKVVHELGHAFTARYFGCRVPAMGVAFLVMLPVLYTDTNDAWKLPDRRQRLLIGSAGMMAELTLAACATLLWCFLPDGPLRASVFLLATTTWVATLLINASPFMRFDGYFLLSDWWGMPNLHARAFAMARWLLRQGLLGLDDPPPEYFPTPRRHGLIIFAWVTWLYRLVVFTSIAFLVYHVFFKALGTLLLMVELGWFIVRPILGELMVWWQRRNTLRWQKRTLRSAVLLAAVILFFVLPWHGDVSSPAVIGAAQSQGLYASEAAYVSEVRVQEGQQVQEGQILAILSSPTLDYQLAQAKVIESSLTWQVEQQPFNNELRNKGGTLPTLLLAAKQQVISLQEQRDRLTLIAPFSGRIADVNDALRAGTLVTQGERLLQVVGAQGVRGEVYLSEETVADVHPGDVARFVPDSGDTSGITCRLGQVDKLNQSTLDQPLLASIYGGPIAAELRGQNIEPRDTVFRVPLESCEQRAAPARELSGKARLHVTAHSLLQQGWHWLLVAMGSEAGL